MQTVCVVCMLIMVCINLLKRPTKAVQADLLAFTQLRPRGGPRTHYPHKYALSCNNDAHLRKRVTTATSGAQVNANSIVVGIITKMSVKGVLKYTTE